MLADIDEILDVRLGTQSVQMIYLGEELVYERQPEYDANMLVGSYFEGANSNDIAVEIDYEDSDGDFASETLRVRDGILKDRYAYFDVVNSVPRSGNIFRVYVYNRFKTIESLPKIKCDRDVTLNSFAHSFMCTDVESINFKGVDCSNVNNMNGAFGLLMKIEYLNLTPLDMSIVTSADYMFSGDEKLKRINFGDNDLFMVCHATNTFHSCTSLTTIRGTLRFQTSVSFSQSPLDDATAEMLLRNVQQVSITQTIEFSPTTYDRISNELKALATSKGWNIVKGT